MQEVRSRPKLLKLLKLPKLSKKKKSCDWGRGARARTAERLVA